MHFLGRAACAALVLAGIALAAAACGNGETASTGNPPVPQTAAASSPPASEIPQFEAIAFTPAPPAYPGELPPFPTSPYAAPRPPDLIKAIYTFAARHPEVLHYVPCFCGCQHSGHSDNDDCFIQRREKNGKPVWDPHGMT